MTSFAPMFSLYCSNPCFVWNISITLIVSVPSTISVHIVFRRHAVSTDVAPTIVPLPWTIFRLRKLTFTAMLGVGDLTLNLATVQE